MDGEFSLEEWGMESEEVSKVNELVMVENEVLECEKNVAVREVEDWKRKCKELELRVLELEGRLKHQGKDGISIGIQGVTSMNTNDVCAQRGLGSPPCLLGAMGAIDGVMHMEDTLTPDKQSVLTEDTPTKKVHVKRRLAYQNKRHYDEKIDRDNECDVHARQKPNSQSERTPCMLEYGVHETDEIMDGVHSEEEQSSGRGEAPFSMTPKNKRKRDLMVVMSDDEGEDPECTPKSRAFKIETSDNEEEEVDITPIKPVSNRVLSESESDDDDDIPISQLKRNRTRGSSQHAGTLNSTRPRRRLVKYGQGESRETVQEKENVLDALTTGNVADDDESSGNESESSVKSLSSFIVSDCDEDVEDSVSQEDGGEDVEDSVSQEDGGDDSSESEEASDSNIDFADIISRLKSRRHPDSKWILEADMLSDFGKNPELCMRAVCALYRQQTNEEKACMSSINHNGRGFSRYDATRGSLLGNFLTDGDQNGDMVKSVEELQEHDPNGVEECHRLATHYSKQLFKISESGEDPYFP